MLGNRVEAQIQTKVCSLTVRVNSSHPHEDSSVCVFEGVATSVPLLLLHVQGNHRSFPVVCGNDTKKH